MSPPVWVGVPPIMVGLKVAEPLVQVGLILGSQVVANAMGSSVANTGATAAKSVTVRTVNDEGERSDKCIAGEITGGEFSG